MKPIIAEQRKDGGEVINELGATFGDIQVNFYRDGLGRIVIFVFLDNQSQARNVEVTLHKFFGGTVSEIFYAEDFNVEEKVGSWVTQGKNFPEDLFVGLVEEKVKVSAKFID